jgi:acetate kinase
MKVLVLNCGSSSLKFQVIEPAGSGPPGEGDSRFARGLIERIGGESTCRFQMTGGAQHEEKLPLRDHEQGVGRILEWLDANTERGLSALDAAGHRVVHGGERFTAPVRIDDEVISVLEGLNELAPLHNPACLSGIRAARNLLGSSTPMVAVFDTSFHHTLPDYAFTYAIPYDLSQRYGIRRYGFHGLAHRYSVLRYAAKTRTPSSQLNLVTLHLGNGCSISAIRGGISVDTSMGFTPLEGLMMGTRSGDLDPAIVAFLTNKEKISPDRIESLLNKQSGLLGVSGRSPDMRELTEGGVDRRAALAVEMFCYRARKYLGAYLAAIGGAKAVVFSGGISENSPQVRAKICAGMEWCGLSLDTDRNFKVVGSEDRISSFGSKLDVYVVPTDEEVLIARDTIAILQSKNHR